MLTVLFHGINGLLIIITNWGDVTVEKNFNFAFIYGDNNLLNFFSPTLRLKKKFFNADDENFELNKTEKDAKKG